MPRTHFGPRTLCGGIGFRWSRRAIANGKKRRVEGGLAMIPTNGKAFSFAAMSHMRLTLRYVPGSTGTSQLLHTGLHNGIQPALPGRVAGKGMCSSPVWRKYTYCTFFFRLARIPARTSPPPPRAYFSAPSLSSLATYIVHPNTAVLLLSIGPQRQDLDIGHEVHERWHFACRGVEWGTDLRPRCNGPLQLEVHHS